MLLQLTFSYLTYKRGARIITSMAPEPAQPPKLRIYKEEAIQPAKHAQKG